MASDAMTETDTTTDPGWVRAEDGTLVPDYDATIPVINEGEVVRGTVVRVDKDEVLVDIGYKSEGVIPVNELSIRRSVNPADEVQLGDEIDALVMTKEDAEGRLILSKKRARFELAWKNIEGAAESGEPVNGTVIEVVKGGLILDLGVRGFLPASLVDIRRVQNLDEFLGEKLRCKVIELNRSRNNVVLSRRAVLEDERKDMRQAILDRLSPGDVVEGTISNIVDFGAFVDLKGIDGLIHISELSWSHVNHPSEVLEIGQSVKVKVLDIDRDRQRISLGLKQTQSDPWQQVIDAYQESDVVQGRVTKVVTFGAFVEILPGVEGLVHISELAQHHVENPREIVAQGEVVHVKIIEMDADRRRLSLSLKRVEPHDDVRPPIGPAYEPQLVAEEEPAEEDLAADEPAADEPAARSSPAPSSPRRSLRPPRTDEPADEEPVGRGAGAEAEPAAAPDEPADEEPADEEPVAEAEPEATPEQPDEEPADEEPVAEAEPEATPSSPPRTSRGRACRRGPGRACGRGRGRARRDGCCRGLARGVVGAGPVRPASCPSPRRRRPHRRYRRGQERGARRVRASRCGDRVERRDRPQAAARGPRGALGGCIPLRRERGRPGRGHRPRGRGRHRLRRSRGALLAGGAAPSPRGGRAGAVARRAAAPAGPARRLRCRDPAPVRDRRRRALRRRRRRHRLARGTRCAGQPPRPLPARAAPDPRRGKDAPRRLRVRERRHDRGARRVRRRRDGEADGATEGRMRSGPYEIHPPGSRIHDLSSHAPGGRKQV